MKLSSSSAALCAAAFLLAAPAAAQQLRTEGPPATPGDIGLLTRLYAPPDSFWLAGDHNRELIRYSHPHAVRLCLPQPTRMGEATHGYALSVRWNPNHRATLSPGNCLHFDATHVSMRPAESLPYGVVLQGDVDTYR